MHDGAQSGATCTLKNTNQRSIVQLQKQYYKCSSPVQIFNRVTDYAESQQIVLFLFDPSQRDSIIWVQNFARMLLEISKKQHTTQGSCANNYVAFVARCTQDNLLAHLILQQNSDEVACDSGCLDAEWLYQQKQFTNALLTQNVLCDPQGHMIAHLDYKLIPSISVFTNFGKKVFEEHPGSCRVFKAIQSNLSAAIPLHQAQDLKMKHDNICTLLANAYHSKLILDPELKSQIDDTLKRLPSARKFLVTQDPFAKLEIPQISMRSKSVPQNTQWRFNHVSGEMEKIHVPVCSNSQLLQEIFAPRRPVFQTEITELRASGDEGAHWTEKPEMTDVNVSSAVSPETSVMSLNKQEQKCTFIPGRDIGIAIAPQVQQHCARQFREKCFQKKQFRGTLRRQVLAYQNSVILKQDASQASNRSSSAVVQSNIRRVLGWRQEDAKSDNSDIRITEDYKNFHSDLAAKCVEIQPSRRSHYSFRKRALRNAGPQVQDLWERLARSQKWKALRWDPPIRE